MPARPPIANTFKLDVFSQFTSSGVAKAHNILHVQPTTSGALPGDIADKAFASWASTFQPLLNAQWLLEGVTCTALDGTGAQGFSSATPVEGGDSSAPLPPQVAVCVSWKIGTSYRGGKPRTYLCGIPTDALAAVGHPQILHSWAEGLVTAAESFLTNMATGDAPQLTVGTVSYVSGKVEREVPLWRPYVLLATEVHERLDSQRRRSGKENAYGISVG